MSDSTQDERDHAETMPGEPAAEDIGHKFSEGTADSVPVESEDICGSAWVDGGWVLAGAMPSERRWYGDDGTTEHAGCITCSRVIFRDGDGNWRHGEKKLAQNDGSSLIQDRLEYLRGEIRAERISYGEIAELQDLAAHIDPDDGELLAWAVEEDE